MDVDAIIAQQMEKERLAILTAQARLADLLRETGPTPPSSYSFDEKTLMATPGATSPTPGIILIPRPGAPGVMMQFVRGAGATGGLYRYDGDVKPPGATTQPQSSAVSRLVETSRALSALGGGTPGGVPGAAPAGGVSAAGQAAAAGVGAAPQPTPKEQFEGSVFPGIFMTDSGLIGLGQGMQPVPPEIFVMSPQVLDWARNTLSLAGVRGFDIPPGTPAHYEAFGNLTVDQNTQIVRAAISVSAAAAAVDEAMRAIGAYSPGAGFGAISRGGTSAGAARAGAEASPPGIKEGGVFHGATLVRVGERSPKDKKYATDEYMLAAPGITVVAPRLKKEKPTAANARRAIFEQILKSQGL